MRSINEGFLNPSFRSIGVVWIFRLLIVVALTHCFVGLAVSTILRTPKTIKNHNENQAKAINFVEMETVWSTENW